MRNSISKYRFFRTSLKFFFVISFFGALIFFGAFTILGNVAFIIPFLFLAGFFSLLWIESRDRNLLVASFGIVIMVLLFFIQNVQQDRDEKQQFIKERDNLDRAFRAANGESCRVANNIFERFHRGPEDFDNGFVVHNYNSRFYIDNIPLVVRVFGADEASHVVQIGDLMDSINRLIAVVADLNVKKTGTFLNSPESVQVVEAMKVYNHGILEKSLKIKRVLRSVGSGEKDCGLDEIEEKAQVLSQKCKADRSLTCDG